MEAINYRMSYVTMAGELADLKDENAKLKADLEINKRSRMAIVKELEDTQKELEMLRNDRMPTELYEMLDALLAAEIRSEHKILEITGRDLAKAVRENHDDGAIESLVHDYIEIDEIIRELRNGRKQLKEKYL